MRVFIKVLAFGLIFGLQACGTSESTGRDDSGQELIEPGRIEIATNADAADAEPVPVDEMNKFQGLLDEAARLHVREEYSASLSAIRKALAQNPPGELGPRFQALELRVKRKLLRQSHIDAFVRFRRDWYTIGETIEGEIILMNISNERLVIPRVTEIAVPVRPEDATIEDEGVRREKTESTTMVRWEMTYREFLPTNTLITNKKTQNFRVAEDIVLEPGQPYTIPITFDTSDINVSGTMYRTYTLRCSIHSSAIQVGDEKFHGRVDYRSGMTGVFPRNAEHLADAPLKRMRQSVAKRSPLHLTLAAAHEERRSRKLTDPVARYLETELTRPNQSDALVDGVMTALLILSGIEEKKSKEEWVEWLKTRVKTTP